MEFFCLSGKGDFGLNGTGSFSSSLPDLGFSHIAGCLLVRHSKTLPVSAWELPTGGRPQAKIWICLAVTQPWEITFPTGHSTTGGMHLSHAAPHHNPLKSGLPVFHLLSKHPESPEVPSIPAEERMDMGQGKGAGPEIQGETLEKDCGQQCYGVWEKRLWQWPWPLPPQPQESTGLTHTLHRPKEELDPAIHHPELPAATSIGLPRLGPSCLHVSILARG